MNAIYYRQLKNCGEIVIESRTRLNVEDAKKNIQTRLETARNNNQIYQYIANETGASFQSSNEFGESELIEIEFEK